MSKILEAIKAYEAAHVLAEQSKAVFSETIMAKIKKLWRLLGNSGNPYNFIHDITVGDQTVTVEFSYSYMGQTDAETEVLPVEFLNDDFDIAAYAENVKAQWAEKERLATEAAVKQRQIEAMVRSTAAAVAAALEKHDGDLDDVNYTTAIDADGNVTITVIDVDEEAEEV